MEKMLTLYNLYGRYKKVNREKRVQVYYNDYSKNTIIFNPLDETCNMETIANGTSERPYFHLMNVLNNNTNVIVHWSQIDGTTSDYDIYFEIQLTSTERRSYNRIMNVLDGYTKIRSNHKYNEVYEGEFMPIVF